MGRPEQAYGSTHPSLHTSTPLPPSQMFDLSYLSFVRVEPSALWDPVTSSVAYSQTTAVVYASSSGRTGPDNL